jgi:hypothetical protein
LRAAPFDVSIQLVDDDDMAEDDVVDEDNNLLADTSNLV